jgi:septum formation protein
MIDRRVVLASASPRRAELLRSVGLEFEVRPADIDESVAPGEDPIAYVRRLSVEKAAAVARPGDLVIAADTTVEVDGVILGKPTDAADARRMLSLLSARTHRVHTGVTVRSESSLDTIAVSTAVTFVTLDAATIDWYIGTGEPMDKAGGYALQGAGGALVERIDGSVSNVIGLPLSETLQLLLGTLGSRLPIHEPTA